MEREAKPQLPDRLAAFRALRTYESAYQAALKDGFSDRSVSAWMASRSKLEQAMRTPGKFALGHTVATRGAIEALREASHFPVEFLIRHKHGDWGELDPEDRAENERSLVLGYRLLSAYDTRNKERLWVVTEADRSSTTLLLPEDY